MTEAGLRTMAATTARSFVGRKESDGGHKEIVDLYNKAARAHGLYVMGYTEPWCAAFTTAVAQLTGMTDIIYPECGCQRKLDKFKKANRWKARGAVPGIGDLVFYDWTGDGIADHEGMVVDVIGTSLLVCEGNKSDEVGIRQIEKSWRFILGFGCPDYAGKAGEGGAKEQTPAAAVETQTKPAATSSDFTIGHRILRRGSRGTDVEALQRMLLGWEIGVGPDGADGIFGGNTEDAVKTYQQKNGLLVDGEAGEKTMGRLNGR